MQILIEINTIYQMKTAEGITESLNSGNQKEWARRETPGIIWKRRG